jgi:guanosine-3',5'-bis(diphosphate) 3'-pyrophosphohydrolase
MPSDNSEPKLPTEAPAELLRALQFAAERHSSQRRKSGDTPYVNHVIDVAAILAVEAGVTTQDVLVAAVLHDTVEDTPTTFAEIEERFGVQVAGLVAEMTDDKRLPKMRRKELQIEHAPELSDDAKRLKLADKIANVRDLSESPPLGWSLERKIAYLDWTEAVVAGCRGVDPTLERIYDEALDRSRAALDRSRAAFDLDSASLADEPHDGAA